MKLTILAGFFLAGAIWAPRAWAVTATFATSNQMVTFTGLGGSGGVGESRVTWGACVYDGTNTKCTMSAPYTGVGGGGTLSAVLTYSGNGPAPLTAVSISPGSDTITFNLTSGSFVISLAENTGQTVTFLSQNLHFQFLLPVCSIGIVSCGPGQVGLSPNSTITGLITGTFDATPVIRTVISASNYGALPDVAPGTWMEIYGSYLANVFSQVWTLADFSGNTGPTALAQTSVTIGGQPAFLYYVSTGQINAQIPSGIAPGPQPVVVTTPGGSSVAYSVNVKPTEPGLLSPAVFKLNGSQYVTALFPDNVTFVLPTSVNGVSTARAKPGDILIFYGVGFGPVTPDSPAGQIVNQANKLSADFECSIGGVPASVKFAGLTSGFLGLYQFNVQVPNIAASDTTPFAFTLGGVPGAQNLVIAIGN